MSLDDFTPPPPSTPAAATYIPIRSTKSQFAVHQNVGHAKRAFADDPEGILYVMRDGAWAEVWRQTKDEITARFERCNGCGAPGHNSYAGVRQWHPDGQYLYGLWVAGELERRAACRSCISSEKGT